MEDVFFNTKVLSDSILNSEGYKNYIEAKNTLEQNQELFNIVKQYKITELQNKLNELQQSVNTFETEKYMSKKYNDLILNDIIRDFLYKEKFFLNMFSKVCQMLSEDLEVEKFENNI